MKKKIMAGAVTLLSVAALAACSNSTDANKDIITMKGDTITVGDFYDKIKSNSTVQQLLVNEVVEEVFLKKYSDKIKDKEVQAEIDKLKKQYGDTAYAQLLAQNNITEEDYKNTVRTNLAVNYAVKKAAEKELTDDAYKEAFKEYTPEVTAQIIQLDSEDKAKEVLEQAKAEGADFAQLAKDNSTDEDTKEKGGEVTFDSTSQTIPTEVQNAAYGLEVNGISDVITVTSSTQGTSQYYIVKLIKKTEKSSNWKDYKDKLKEIIITSKQSDSAFVQEVVTKELQAANIKVKDEAFQNVFAQYINQSSTNSSGSSSAASSSSSTSSSSEESTEASSESSDSSSSE